jgi:hypothetical protein
LKRQVLQPAFQRGLKEAGNFRFFYEDRITFSFLAALGAGILLAMERTELGTGTRLYIW